MGGGPSQQQKDAAAREAELAKTQSDTSKEMLGMYRDQYNKINPFETNILNNGLPYLKALTDYANGTTARSALPARAALLRSFGGNSSLTPNGFKTGATTDFDTNLEHSFDDNMAQALTSDYNARQQAASLLTNQQQLANPLGWSTAASGSNNGIMNAPLATPSPFGAVLGAGAALGSSAITKF